LGLTDIVVNSVNKLLHNNTLKIFVMQ
jgi:hypothetical protein